MTEPWIYQCSVCKSYGSDDACTGYSDREHPPTDPVPLWLTDKDPDIGVSNWKDSEHREMTSLSQEIEYAGEAVSMAVQAHVGRLVPVEASWLLPQLREWARRAEKAEAERDANAARLEEYRVQARGDYAKLNGLEAEAARLREGLRTMLDSRGSDEALVANWRAMMAALLSQGGRR